MRFFEFFVQLSSPVNFEQTDENTSSVSRFSLFTAAAAAVWCTLLPQTPRQGHPSISRAVVSCSSVEGHFLSRFVQPQIPTIFDRWSTSIYIICHVCGGRCRSLLKKKREINIERKASSCDEPLSSHRCSPVSTRSSKRSIYIETAELFLLP